MTDSTTQALSLTAIAAVAANGVIGDGRDLLWHLPADFARFKRVTMGGVLIMGRRTYESLGKALPGRTSIILTQSTTWRPTNTNGQEVLVAKNLGEVARLLAQRPDQSWWSTGGGQIYRLLWDYTTALDLTEVQLTPTATITFPALDATWRETSRIAPQGPCDSPGPDVGYKFVRYERIDDQAARALASWIANAV
jgi:dihydrofolate reductase